MNVSFGKRGAAEWTLTKVVSLILGIIILILLVFGVVSGALGPLHESIVGRIDSVLIMFGLKDAVFFQEGGCTFSGKMNLEKYIGEDFFGDFYLCSDGTCEFRVGLGIYVYDSSEETLRLKDVDSFSFKEQDKLFNALFNGGIDKLYSLMEVESYDSVGEKNGLDKYMGGENYNFLDDDSLTFEMDDFVYFVSMDSWFVKKNNEVITSGGKVATFSFDFDKHLKEGSVENFLYTDGEKEIDNFDNFLKYNSEIRASFEGRGVIDGKISNEWELRSFSALIPFYFVGESRMIAPDVVDIDEMRRKIVGKKILVDGVEYVLGVEIGKGGLPVVSMTSGDDKYGLYYYGYSETFKEGKKDDFRSEFLRLMMWKMGREGMVGWYSHGDVNKYKIRSEIFKMYYFLNYEGEKRDSILSFFQENCR